MVGTHAALRSGGPPAPRTTAAVVPAATSRSGAARNPANRPTASASARLTQQAQKLTGPLRGQWATQAVAPELHGSRAAAWISMWDKGSAVRRASLLETLKRLHAESNSSALDADLGDAAPLFFARLTSWWKLRYGAWVVEATAAAKGAAAAPHTTATAAAAAAPSPPTATATTATTTTAAAGAASPAPTALPASELLAQVEAVTIFVRGSRYLLQFVEGGGAAALCDCLAATSSIPVSGVDRDGHTRERRAMTLLLLHIAHSGRVYREMVGDVPNLLHLLHALQRETDAGVAIPITDLLAVLGKGHPGLAGSVNTGLLRVMVAALPATSDEDDGAERARGGDAMHRSEVDAVTQLPCAAPEVVVLSVARAVRALQLQVEQQHYAQHSPMGDVCGEQPVLAAAARVLDYVPIVGLDASVTTGGGFSSLHGGGGGAGSLLTPPDPLLVPFSTTEYLQVLFRLALDEQHTAYRVEGNELLNLAAKNMHLTPRILTRCLDVVDDDVYTIEAQDAEEGGVAPHRLRRQRRQLSCGRAAVLILISRPMTAERRDLLLHLVAQRGGHLTLLKYLRLTQHGDSAAVVDCCHALQFIARASTEAQRRQRLGQASTMTSTAGGRGGGANATVLVRMTEGVQAALGDAVFQQLLFQELSEEDCMAILRSARAAVASGAL